MDSRIYIYYLNPNLHEGGSSRNTAFFNKLAPAARSINVYRTTGLKRLFVIFSMLLKFLTLSGKKVFIHQGAILFLFPLRLLQYKAARFIFNKVITRFSSRNSITVEVNDLPYEQSMDLGLPVKSGAKYFQEILYSVPKVRYIFAANLMRDFAVKQYGTYSPANEVVVNGAPRLSSPTEKILKLSNDKRLKFIYSGTLNKGRDIEKLIDLFSVKPEKLLVLIGTNGEWIADQPHLPENILYLGSFSEKMAHQIVSICDVGLLHYDEKKLYYNICFPTKASFYITAGVAVLSTPIEEIYNHFKDNFIFKEITAWDAFLSELTPADINSYKAKVQLIKDDYIWDNLLSNITF